MNPNLRNWLIIAAILTVTFGLAMALGHRYQITQLSRATSTFNPSPFGLKGVYVALERLHRPVTRWQHPWTKLSPQHGVLIFTEPSDEELAMTRMAFVPLEEESRELERWVARGNTVVFYGQDGFIRQQVLLDLWGTPMVNTATNFTRRADDRERPAPPLFETPHRNVVGIPGVMPLTFTRGVQAASIEYNAGLKLRGEAVVPVLVGADNAVHGQWLIHERGNVLLFSSASFIDNQFIVQPDNFALLLGVLREFAGEGEILFDEYHHGYSEEFALHDFVALPMVKAAAAQLALVIGLLIFSQWRRFGDPVPLVREMRRSVMEYAVSLGDLYARAETQRETLDYLYSHLRRELIDRHGLRATATPAEIADRLDTTAEIRQQWVALAQECERPATAKPLTRREFGELARRIQEFRRQLR